MTIKLTGDSAIDACKKIMAMKPYSMAYQNALPQLTTWNEALNKIKNIIDSHQVDDTASLPKQDKWVEAMLKHPTDHEEPIINNLKIKNHLRQVEMQKDTAEKEPRKITVSNELAKTINDNLPESNTSPPPDDKPTAEKKRPKIVCLCGSTRFMEQFVEAGCKFTLENWIVLSVGVCKHAKHHGAEALGQDVADRLDELHLRKIDLADLVYVLNVNGYIGESTSKEIKYAKKIGVEIEYLESK